MSVKKQKLYPAVGMVHDAGGKFLGFAPLRIVWPVPIGEKEEICKHKYVHQSANCYIQPVSSTTDNYVRIDMYYCEKCLDQKVIKKEHRRVMYSGSDTIPDWWIKKDEEKL